MSKKYPNIHWLTEEEYKKAEGQLRLQLNGVFGPFNQYGLHIFVPGAIDEVVKLAQSFSLRTRGVDKPISLDRIRSKKK